MKTIQNKKKIEAKQIFKNFQKRFLNPKTKTLLERN